MERGREGGRETVMHARARARTHLHLHTHMHTCTHTRARARARAHTHTHTHRSRAHSQARLAVSMSSPALVAAYTDLVKTFYNYIILIYNVLLLYDVASAACPAPHGRRARG